MYSTDFFSFIESQRLVRWKNFAVIIVCFEEVHVVVCIIVQNCKLFEMEDL